MLKCRRILPFGLDNIVLLKDINAFCSLVLCFEILYRD